MINHDKDKDKDHQDKDEFFLLLLSRKTIYFVCLSYQCLFLVTVSLNTRTQLLTLIQLLK